MVFSQKQEEIRQSLLRMRTTRRNIYWRPVVPANPCAEVERSLVDALRLPRLLTKADIPEIQNLITLGEDTSVCNELIDALRAHGMINVWDSCTYRR